MKTVEQGVLFALDKASTPQAKRDPEDVEENFDIYMHNSDGDDEDDDDEVPQPRLAGRKKPGKRSIAENTFNYLLRDYLTGKGLRASPEDLPAPPSSFEINLFVEDNQGGPSVDTPRFDWFSTFKSAWNDELAYMLAIEFCGILQESSNSALFEADKDFTLPKYIKAKLVSTLSRVRKSYKDFQPSPVNAKENDSQKKLRLQAQKAFQQKMAHRLSRRIGTFERRGAIIKSRYDESEAQKDMNSTKFWKKLKKIHAELGQDGMSSDETDSEQTGLQAKIVRRIPKTWLIPTISELWNAVEKYGKGRLNRVGNSPHTRIFEPSSSFRTQPNTPAQRRLCVPGLPLNYYCDLWLRGLSPAQRAQVDRKSPRELPSYEHILV
ncbi:hypothetical protein K443DRAFT_7839 [Laccaria amethystina LaAM-08-1]|uniref:Uncharacterized protein n=1 Tax=Laccaria amethystina LaAM-08-1 TaxID=1095629 RepID=A0A0C9X567_9AGAR|nr:hypothetical protein K443DRAFT_7839 [Laccaria amethystina LaAM-08-1]